MYKSLVVFAAVSAIFGSDANATVTSYVFSGDFENGTTFSGGFDADDTKNLFDQFSDISLVTSDGSAGYQIHAISTYGAFNSTSTYGLIFFDNIANVTVGIYFTARHEGFVLKEIMGNQLISPTHIQQGNNLSYLNSGTIGLLAQAPEPSSWAMMLAGFGAIGGALRSRRKIAVAFG